MSDPAPKRIIDLRGFAAPVGVTFVEEDRPVRLRQENPDTADWANAQFELRTVEETAVEGFQPGDVILFSRVEPAITSNCFADD